jgi:uncharacterized protein YjeT (DUF2065 family)
MGLWYFAGPEKERALAESIGQTSRGLIRRFGRGLVLDVVLHRVTLGDGDKQ